MISSCLLQDALQPVGETGVLAMEATYTKRSGALGEEETHSTCSLV